MKSLYLWVNFLAVIVPFIFSFHPKLKFNKQFKAFFKANIIVTIAFVLWDFLYTHLGVWGFNDTYITGIHLGNLPIEEWMFFVFIPFCCVYTYHCLTLFFPFSWSKKANQIIPPILAIVLLVLGIAFWGKLYTSATFISLGVVIFLLVYVAKVDWFSKAVYSYLILLIPFCVVNGVLTGSGLPDPVVWYNDAENLGIRILTIPVEDIFYGFLLFVLNVFFYERFKTKTESNEKLQVEG